MHFREGVCRTFMPWSPEYKAETPFEGRIEGVNLDRGSVAHVTVTPIIAARTNADVARSSAHGFYASYLLSGDLQLEQGGRATIGKPGDLFVYETSLPLAAPQKGGPRHESLGFFFSRDCFSIGSEDEHYFRNVVLTHDTMPRPLSSCLAYLAGNLTTGSKDELQALFDASASLLPVALGCYDKRESNEREPPPSNAVLRGILEFVDRNISDVELSPRSAAEHFGITPRYVHKVFAASSTTFSAYVLAKRLEHIRGDLLSPTCGNRPISVLAFRWGFNDLSSFNRAFKNRYRCSPSEFRGRFAR
jgi:AraC family transcriptional regulator, positive regulator of tynA and feaB